MITNIISGSMHAPRRTFPQTKNNFQSAHISVHSEFELNIFTFNIFTQQKLKKSFK